MTASRIGKSFGNRPVVPLLHARRLQQTPTRGQRLFELDSERLAALGRTASAWPNMVTGRLVGAQRWSRQWSGDQLTKVEPSVEENCTDQTGAFCPKFSEARARQALAELQLAEFNHRLANVLQKLVNRIERQRRIQDDSERRAELESLIASIHASAQLHRYLLPLRTQMRVDLKSLLADVAAAIEGVTGLLCDVEVEPVNVPNLVAVHLAVIVNELACNAHKHAYGGAEGGKIRIVCRRDTDGRLRLSVADQGCGLPADFDPRVSEGLGFMVVCATARQFDGELQAESHEGARFTLLLTIPDL